MISVRGNNRLDESLSTIKLPKMMIRKILKASKTVKPPLHLTFDVHMLENINKISPLLFQEMTPSPTKPGLSF